MSNPIFCPTCNTLILDAPRCLQCGWERPSAAQTGPGQVAWQRRFPAGLASGVTYGDGVIYFVDREGKLHALSAEQGEAVWPQPIDWQHWRVFSQMAVVNGLLVLGPTDVRSIAPADKAVVALDAATGQERWRAELHCSQIFDPAVADDTVLVATSDSSVVALALVDGRVRWRQSHKGFYQAAPATGGGLAIVGGNKGLMAAYNIDNGERVWVFEASDAGSGLNDFPYPAVVSEDVVYATNWDRHCYALELATGALRWQSERTHKREPMTSPLVTAEAVYFCGHDRHVYCLDKDKGHILWSQLFPRRADVPPLLIDGKLLVGFLDQTVCALDARSGEALSEPLLHTEGKLTKAWACDGQRLFMGDDAGYVYALNVAAEAPVTDAIMFERAGRWEEAAAFHALQGSLDRAAAIYAQQLAQPEAAAQLYERAGMMQQAAEQYALAGGREGLIKARALWHQAGMYAEVAELSVQLEDWLAAAQACEAGGDWLRAGDFYRRLEKWSQAAAAYEQAGKQASQNNQQDAASAAWVQAARIYERKGQLSKALQLYKDAARRDEANRVFTDIRQQRQWSGNLLLGRWLHGARQLGAMLAEDGEYRLAALEYQQAGEIKRAAEMFEKAGESTLAADLFASVGLFDEAARLKGAEGDWRTAAEFYRQGGHLRRAAAAYARAEDHAAAAGVYMTLEQWPAAAQAWQQAGRWDRAAEAWGQAKAFEKMAKAWESGGEYWRAGQAYWQAATHAEANAAGDPEQTALLLDEAIRLFDECHEMHMAQQCDIRRRRLRKQPLLEVVAQSSDEFRINQSGRLVLSMQNVGWGHASHIDFAISGELFSIDMTQTSSWAGLAHDRPASLRKLYIIPKQAGTALPLHLTITYDDREGAPMPPVRQTIEITVQEKIESGMTTPHEIHYHGTVVQSEQVGEIVTGDQIKITRERIVDPGAATLPAVTAASETVTCLSCQRKQPATTFKCQQCGNPFFRCPSCGLALPEWSSFCTHCSHRLS